MPNGKFDISVTSPVEIKLDGMPNGKFDISVTSPVESKLESKSEKV